MVYVKNKKVQIYAITGAKCVGKDTFANLVVGFNKKFTTLKFANPLKKIVHEIFNVALEDMESFDSKERFFTHPIMMDSYLAQMSQATGLSLQPRHKKAHNVREILQYFGTDYVRSIEPDYWVNIINSEIKRVKNYILITDARFDNEVSLVRKLGGKIINITMMGSSPAVDSHISENGLDTNHADIYLNTMFNKFDIQKRAAFAIARNNEKLLYRHDYRNIEQSLSMYTSGASISKCSIILGLHPKESKVFDIFLNYYNVKKRSNKSFTHRHHDGNTKACSMCKERRPLNFFGFSTRSPDQLFGICKLCRSSSYIKKGRIDSLKKLFSNIKKNSKYRMIPFTLSYEDFEEQWNRQNGHCYYSNIKMNWIISSLFKVSVDRIDSKLGYTNNNTVFCCVAVNMMKNKLDIKTMSLFVDEMFKNKHQWSFITVE